MRTLPYFPAGASANREKSSGEPGTTQRLKSIGSHLESATLLTSRTMMLFVESGKEEKVIAGIIQRLSSFAMERRMDFIFFRFNG